MTPTPSTPTNWTPPALVTVAEVEDFVSDVGLLDLDTDKVEDTRDYAIARIEDACGVAFVEREEVEIATGRDGFALLSRPRVIEVLKIDNVSAVSGPYPEGRIPLDDGDHSILYRHGYETTPLPIKRAVLLLTRHYLTIDPTDIDERATSKSTEMASWSLVTPGVRGAIFPIPEVNQIVSDYSYAGDVV
jgi:hypothetical protein